MGNKVLLSIVIFLSILAAPVFAANVNWTNNGGDRVFQNPANWASDPNLPGIDDQARIVLADGNAPIIDANHTDPCNMSINQVRVGHSGNAGDLTMIGGIFNVVDNGSGILYVGNNAVGRYYHQGGAATAKNLYIGHKSGANGSLMTISGGTVDLSNNLHLGRFGGQGTLNMEAGTLDVGNNLIVGKWDNSPVLYGDGTLNMTGGTINVPSGDFDISSDGSPGHVQLDGGLISGSSFVMDANGSMDITDGTLELSGDKTSTVQGFVDNGWITAGGADIRAIKIDYNSDADKTTVTVDTSILALAAQPTPSNGAVLELGPGETVALSWTPGDYSSPISPSHRIIVSETYADVNDRTGPAVTQDENSLPVVPEFGKTYYWSVDEANATTTWDLGPVWSFEIEEYVLIDDFEDYADSNDIVLSWAAAGGASVSLATEYSGQIMRVGYNNNSEASLTYSPAVDFSANGIKALELWVHGDVNNAPGDLTVTLEDGDANSATLQYGDPNAIIQETWEGWIAILIDLADFTGLGVDITDVAKLTLGVVSSGTGFVDVDDIRLYGSRCVPGNVSTSFDGDCTTDLSDVGVIFDSWLEAEYDVNASPPDDNDLLLHYTFDETSGSTATDSSTNGHTGSVKLYIDPNDANGVAYSTGWDAGGYDNGCLDFNGFVSVSLPNDVFAGVASELTVSVWVKSDANVNPNAVGRADFGAGPSDPNLWWDRVSWVQDNPADYIGQWSHYAFVKDAGSSKMRIYHDGLLVAQNKDASQLIDGAGAGASSIGSSYDNQTGFFDGKMDEFRVYDYALPHAEVLYLAAGSSGSLHQPLTPVLSPVDPILDGTINFKDYEVLASVWMQEILWP
jgi:hypothetical protein